MRGGVEILGGIFLLWYLILPAQNYELLIRYSGAAFGIWVLLALVLRTRGLVSASLFFQFCLLIAFHVRAVTAAGWMASWYTAILCAACVVLLLLHWKSGKTSAAIFLLVVLISPLYWPILHVRNPAFPGVLFWMLAVVHAAWLASEGIRIAVPRILLLYLAVTFLAVPFSIYPWRALQFSFIQCASVLLYCSLRSLQGEVIRRAAKYAYLFLSLSLVLFAFWRDLFTIQHLGWGVLATRHHLLEHANTLAPLYIIFSAILLHFVFSEKQRTSRILILSILIAVGILEFLTYSRSGWISYVCFLAIYGLLTTLHRKKVALPLKKILAVCVLITGLLLLLEPIRKMSVTRISDTMSISGRQFAMKLGLQTILQHPVTGTGWFNYYYHAKLFPNSSFDNILENIALRDVHNHSLFLDLAEAGGIPLLIIFLLFLTTHFKKPFEQKALVAGIAGVTINNVVDTASLWMTVFPHFWILLALKRTTLAAIPLRRIVPAIGVIVGAAAISGLAADHYLQRGNFFARITNGNREAIRSYKLANFFSPLDVLPCEMLKDVYLSQPDIPAAKSTFNELFRLKKEFAPYYVQYARLQAVTGDPAGAHENLSRAMQLDPYGVLSENQYVVAADIDFRRSSSEYKKWLYRALMIQRPSDYRAKVLVDSIPDQEFIQDSIAFAISQTSTSVDLAAMLENMADALVRMNKISMARAYLEAVFSLERLSQSDRDIFAYHLSNLYLQQRDIPRLEWLKNNTAAWAKFLVAARYELSQGNFSAARNLLDTAIKPATYHFDASFWQDFWTRYGDERQLRSHFQTLELLPSYNHTSTYRLEIAKSYAREARYRDAADEFHHLSFYDYSDPAPHWYEARMLWLAGEEERAGKANLRLKNFIPWNPVTQNLYRSRIISSHISDFSIVRAELPNETGGKIWKTAVFAHPATRIILPEDVTLTSLAGAAAVRSSAWSDTTDGFVFTIMNGIRPTYSIRVDPRSNPEHRRWVPFAWNVSTPVPVTLVTSAGKDPYYDWALVSIDEAH